MTLPDAPLVSLEQALTGTEDGHWIQMRGYVRKVTPKDGAVELQLVAPGGEFMAHVPKEDAGRCPARLDYFGARRLCGGSECPPAVDRH